MNVLKARCLNANVAQQYYQARRGKEIEPFTTKVYNTEIRLRTFTNNSSYQE